MNKKIIVYEYSCYSEDIPTKPNEFIDFWNSKIKLIPDKYMNSAAIIIEADTQWNIGMLEMEVSYVRPETNKDRKERVSQENKDLTTEKENLEKRLGRLNVKIKKKNN